MARTFETLNIALDNCIEAGVIYNVDFQEWKTYGATRLLEKEIDTVKKGLFYRVEDRSEEMTDLGWNLVNISIMTFPSKKLINSLKVADASDDFTIAIQAIVDRWTPVAEKFKTLKPMIQKGRKPSTTPRQTPERTLDNTGTCACCGQNVKLSGGKIVNHGFTLRHGFQEGQCPAVGCDPIEVSTEGLLKLGEMLNRMLMSANSAALTLNARIHTTTDAEKLKAVKGQAYQAERQVRWMTEDLARVQQRVVDWKPSALPVDPFTKVAA